MYIYIYIYIYTSHLLDIIDELNSKSIPYDTILVSLDIVNMYPSIENDRGIAAIMECLRDEGI